MELHGIMKAFPKVKRAGHKDGKGAPPLKRKSEETSVTGKVFEGTVVFILPACIGKARCQIFERQIVQNGGLSESSFCPSVTHVVVDDSMDRDRALRLLKSDVLPPGVFLVKCTWLSSCITEKRLLDTADFSLLSPERHPKKDTPLVDVKEELSMHVPAGQDVKDTVPEEPRPDKSSALTSPPPPPPPLLSQLPETTDNLKDEDGVSQGDLEALISGQHPKDESPSSSTVEHKAISGKWVCAQSSQSKVDNHNKHITDKLEVLAKAYTHQGDKWRALGYSKAVNALKSYHKPITSYGEAFRIPGIGKRMADKIDEILESGHLRKLDHIGEAVPVLELFNNIWGAGAKTAQLWYQQGFRTLEDIRTKGNLNHIQKIGLKHYDDFLDRMPREEASAIEKTVREAALTVDPGLLAIACGSYRRGKTTCGDVDVLISHPDGHSHKGVFVKVLQLLHQSGFLTDDLVSHEENGEQKKYMGVCCLPGSGRRHRRLDIIVVPYGEFACSLVYFTGSAHFNRSLRALAKTKRMSLSEHSLNRDVQRQGSVKVHGGTPMHTPQEQDVFNLLGVPFREPHERDW